MFQLPDPQTKKWSQTNNSDRFGSIAVSRNLDFDSEGYLKLAKRSRSLYDSSVSSNLGTVLGFAYDNSNLRYYMVTTSKMWYIDSTLKTMTNDVSSNVPTTLSDGSDICVFNGKIHVAASITDGLRSWSGSAWSTELYSLSSNTAPMCVFESKASLAIGQSNTVLLLATDYSLTITLTLPANYQVLSMAYANNRIWIATRHSKDGEALLFEWDGNDTSANNGYPCGSVRIDSVKPYKGSVVIFTGEGQLLLFNGGGFTQLGALPVYYLPYRYSTNGNSATGGVGHRGMCVVGDVVHVNLISTLRVPTTNQLAPAFLNSMPGGVWTYDPQVGFYHRHAPSADRRLQSNAVATTDVNTSTEVITIGGVTVPESGTPVFYDDGANGAGTAIGGLTHRTKYYTIYVSGTTMKLATTYANAIAGTAIDLTGTGNNSQFFVYVGNHDYGGDRQGTPCGITPLVSADPIFSDGYELLFGGSSPKAAVGTVLNLLNTAAAGQENRGIVITSRLDSSVITDDIIKVYVKYKGVKTAEDAILLKYRFIERYDIMKYLDTKKTQTATFTSTTTFTTTADLSLAEVGDEVTFHFGTQQGYTAHISSISLNAGTYTVTIDETMKNLTTNDTCLFTIDFWHKHKTTITTATNDTYTNDNGDSITGIGGVGEFQIGKKGRYFQLKLELRGEDVAIEDIMVNNKPFQSLIA